MPGVSAGSVAQSASSSVRNGLPSERSMTALHECRVGLLAEDAAQLLGEVGGPERRERGRWRTRSARSIVASIGRNGWPRARSSAR